ncbi:MAG: hypothetical protein OHK93_005785 [Ramalina farinacea]|uniref:Uncharacterized protein n=1 Tax=Ramalina farinacea TaxID=258253 RepID=A0AA43TSY3_9LECA|nr:hypothetical protein [Ramalina farinacea]
MNIIAALLGGSSVYRPAEGDSGQRSRDWDGALIVARKIDIFTLVNEHRSSLMAMLDIEHEEHPSLQVPSPTIARWNDFDAVRFAGFTNAGKKKSVKILSMESFSSPTNTTLNILSFKDKRIFDSSTPQGKIYHRVRQASRIEDGLCILHDQLIFKAETGFCAHGNDAGVAGFGPTADLLMSGVWIIGDATYGQSIQSRILRCYAAVAGRHATVETMARFPRFSHAHRQWLSDRLLGLNAAIRIPARCECIIGDDVFLFGSNHRVASKIDSKVQCQERRLPPEYQFNKEVVKLLQGPVIQPSIFSSNSTNWTITLAPPQGTDLEAVKLFCKRSNFAQHERAIAEQAAIFYPHIQIPSVAPSGDLLYPHFEGKSEAERRLSFIRAGRSDWRLSASIMEIEMIRAEDMLRAYRRSLEGSIKSESTSGSRPIDRFYHTRLIDNARFKKFYSDGVEIHGRVLPLTTFLSLRLKVNGHFYPSLNEISLQAARVLHPEATSLLQAFGLGDAHCANVMVSGSRGLDNRRELLYVDYDAAGYHSVVLDLAKPFYNDIFFETLYADLIQDLPAIQYTLNGEANLIEINMSTASQDQLASGILNIKRRYLMEPLFEFLGGDRGGGLGEHIPQFAYALFSCACLARNFKGQWASLFRNIAVGVMFSQAKNLEGIWACCRMLGFH